MAQARGNVRKILEKVNKMQDLVGLAAMNHHDDRNKDGHKIVSESLDKIHELCIQITSLYDPI